MRNDSQLGYADQGTHFTGQVVKEVSRMLQYFVRRKGNQDGVSHCKVVPPPTGIV